MNLPDVGVASEYICPGFTAVSLPATLSAFRSLLFPSSNRADIIKRVNSYTMLMISAGIPEIFTIADGRITYTLDDLNVFGNTPDNLIDVATSVIDSSVTSAMIKYQTNNPKYIGLYSQSPVITQQLAGAIAAYSFLLT